MDKPVDIAEQREQVFSQREAGRLSDFARKEWEFHKDVIDATLQRGWDNPDHPWMREMQDFWRYPLAFSSYAIPSLVIIEEDRFAEAADCLRKSILLLKDTPVWDGWVRKGQGPDPVCCQNIMYKGHLNLLYGLYQMMTGSREFETQFRQLTAIIVSEYEYNGTQRGFWGIECEDDQYFPPCNSQGILSVMVYDKVFGTDYYDRFASKVARFMAERVSDPATNLPLYKYHPSHDQAEAYISGANASWTLTQIHVTDSAFTEEAFRNFKRLLIEPDGPDAAYVKECTFAPEPAMGFEESMGILYVPGLAREYGDPDLWEKATRYLARRDGLVDEGAMYRLRGVAPEQETYVQSYLLWGSVHEGWRTVLDHDWEGVIRRKAGE